MLAHSRSGTLYHTRYECSLHLPGGNCHPASIPNEWPELGGLSSGESKLVPPWTEGCRP
jgi:hypothetical protein